MKVENTKCECGHQNPVGTVLCESCGKPLVQLSQDELLEMRYDGIARRSQRKNPNVIDRIWRFFSSVKVAVYLIFITLVLAIFGTIYPQENVLIGIDPKEYYRDNYGMLGEIYHFLGFSRTYETWWFLTLLIMIGTSLVVCSLDRVLPLYRALNKQQIRKHPQFLKRQRISWEAPIDQQADDTWVQNLSEQLRKKHYKVRTEGTALLAEKNRFSRWGPYINHIGLIVFLLAVMLRGIIPGVYMDTYISLLEGETKPIEGTPYYIKNEQFTVEFYQEDEVGERFREEGRVVPKVFETKAVLYECVEHCEGGVEEPVLKEVATHPIQVNHALKYEGLLVYQTDYQFTPFIQSVKTVLANRETGEKYGEMMLDIRNPDEEYEVGPYSVRLNGYYPDFSYEDGVIVNRSSQPNAPAFVFLISGPDIEGSIPHIYFPRPDDKERFQQDAINLSAGSPFMIEVGGMEDVDIALYTTLLNIRVDKVVPYLFIGAAISMIGLIMGFYWHHRRIWLRVDDGQLLLGAHTNKNWFGFRKEISGALAKTGIDVNPKLLEKDGDKP